MCLGVIKVNDNDIKYINDLQDRIIDYQESIKLALNHIHTGNFTLATVELNKALLKEVEQ